MSTPSSADERGRASPDSSLIGDDGIVVTSFKGLVYPLGSYGPGEGELKEVAPGVHWARLPIPGGLAHINVWALDDRDGAGEGVALVDTGMNLPVCKASWEALFAGPLAGRRVTRVFATHCHPDHIGLAGWLCERFGVALWMTRTEWLTARLQVADQRDDPPRAAIDFWRGAGWDEGWIAAVAAKGWSRFAQIVSAVPSTYFRIVDGDEISIGDHVWRVVVGNGHTNEHACLWAPDLGVMISGDQVLPRITSNVSLQFGEPGGDPLGDWLASIDHLLTLPADMLVLPAHGSPFSGLHTRLAALRDGHLARLSELAGFLDQPRTAVDCFPFLFRRALQDDDRILATGETMAHLRRLEKMGVARRETKDGVIRFRAD